MQGLSIKMDKILIAKQTNGLYLLKGTINKEMNEENNLIEDKSETTMDRRKKMGHLNMRDLQESDRKGNIRGTTLKKLSDNVNCEVCIEGKMTRSPFPVRTERSSESLEIIHSDVWGPARVISNSGARYFITFIDDFSGW